MIPTMIPTSISRVMIPMSIVDTNSDDTNSHITDIDTDSDHTDNDTTVNIDSDDTDSDDIHNDTDVNINSDDTDVETNNDTSSDDIDDDTNIDIDSSDTDVNTDSNDTDSIDADVGANTDTSANADVSADADINAGISTDANIDTIADTKVSAENDTDTDIDLGADADVNVDTDVSTDIADAYSASFVSITRGQTFIFIGDPPPPRYKKEQDLKSCTPPFGTVGLGIHRVNFKGTKAGAEYTNGVYDIVSPAQSVYFGTLQILHLLEDLKLALEMLKDPQEKEALRNQIPGTTAACIHDWLEENLDTKRECQIKAFEFLISVLANKKNSNKNQGAVAQNLEQATELERAGVVKYAQPFSLLEVEEDKVKENRHGCGSPERSCDCSEPRELQLLKWARSMDSEIDIYKHFTWLKRSQVSHHTSASNETYQERLARLEGDKESLILQVCSIQNLQWALELHQYPC
ncbi:hypothetical protein JD844_021725 [Phrynosoma platyrhinos]|uniref:Uncharacterized protein n=1 Tax=Phrynosoma platyrhinos TaxID=52577 RepID=A0ABQ7SU44_PHRPL|nr:hypothetical protein JD844_021725 [Phrynosoma platyrhinos]